MRRDDGDEFLTGAAIGARKREGRRRLLPSLLAAAFLLCASPGAISAQDLFFAGLQSVLPASGLVFPSSVAVDLAGNVYIAEFANHKVPKLPAGGGAQITVPLSGLGFPGGLAVDAAGDLFISDLSNNRVLELPAGGGTQLTVGTSGLNAPRGLAVDAAGYSHSRSQPSRHGKSCGFPIRPGIRGCGAIGRPPARTIDKSFSGWINLKTALA